MVKYFRVWRQLAVMAAASYMSNRIEYSSYFLGKVLRFLLLLLMIVSIFNHAGNIAGYTKYQTIAFFLTAFLVDTIGQAFFRGVYLFRDDIRKGNFDFVVSKPINSLFYSLLRLPDFLDVIFLVPLSALIFYTFSQLGIFQNSLIIFLYLAFVFLSIIIIAAIHIISVSFAVWTMESESFIWIFRNAMFIGLFPPEIFSSSVQLIFTFAVPIIIIVAVPAKALLGLLTFEMAIIALAVAFVFFGGSLLLWRVALKHYSSASS